MNGSRRFLWMVTVLAVAGVAGSGTAFGQMFPVAQNCTATLVTQGVPPLSMYLLPNGTGTQFAACYDATGVIVNATVVVTLKDGNNNPAINVPASSVRLEQLGSPLSWCSGAFYPPPAHAPNLADGPSNLAGQSTFTLSYHGGGWLAAPLTVWVLEATGAWNPVPTPLPVSFNSADLNGDLIVNLTDIALFAADYFGPYNYRSDFNNDTWVNLSDVPFMAAAIGVSCP